MDIDQLTPEQIELSFKLCDILSLEDLTVAATVLSGYNWNIEVILLLSRKQSMNSKSATFNRAT